MKKISFALIIIICFATNSFSQITTTTRATINTPTIRMPKQKTIVQNQLMQLAGVTSANVNLTTGQTYVTYNTGLCNKTLLKKTINSMGHTADELVYAPVSDQTPLTKKGKN